MTVSKVTIYNPHITQMISWLNECEYIHNIMQSPYYQNNFTAYLSVSIYAICNPHDAQMISWPTCTSVRIYTTRINNGFIISCCMDMDIRLLMDMDIWLLMSSLIVQASSQTHYKNVELLYIFNFYNKL